MRVFLLIASLLLPAASAAAPTQFGIDVNDAIEQGLAFLRAAQSANGQWGDNDSDATGLAMLCFLEKREHAGWEARALGYSGMNEADQERVRRAAARCATLTQAFESNPSPSYQVGSCLMGMTTYLITGGPDDAGGAVNVSTAIQTGVQKLKQYQGINQNGGGWNYHNPGNDGDLSTTQFAMAGLAAAQAIVPDASVTLPQSIPFIQSTQKANGGHGYRGQGAAASYEASSSMTASGIWTYRLSGLQTHDPKVQLGLSWINNNYNYERIIQPAWNNSQQSYYYFLWAAAKALEVTGDDGGGAALYADQIGGLRNPIADGYPDESPRWYYDFAWQIMQHQADNGSWCNGDGRCYVQVAATSFAILVLERSLGGVCIIDEDGDEICDDQDNCLNSPNPEQEDADEDGRGDICDNCPNVFNPDQIDDDGDLIGDACDDIVCIPDNPIDICDGRDNDCDGQIDEGGDQGQPAFEPGACATGQVGICALGERDCVMGEVVCVPNASPEEERCDGLDNNCDGFIDEGLLNACGVCGPPPPQETCNCEDDDCDGEIDEGALCGDGVCADCRCWDPCEGPECLEAGTFCDPNAGVCVEACTLVDCVFGEVCERGACVDPCEAVTCGPNLRCFMGECVAEGCAATGCPEGQICDGVSCVADPCAAIRCGAGEFCRGGACVLSCALISCPHLHECLDGICVNTGCGGVVCPDGQRCECYETPCEGQGECLIDLCAATRCGPHQRCEAGACVFDDCEAITCPPGQVCAVRDGVPQCARLDPPVGGGG
ncbi:hypothetical protein KKB55_01230, partial [Myxococcota bacterium]|nr:hypothetical protein [Myxococcota bacterium]